jgi:glycosyltransferase involved in cell wall biosynthesis
MFSVVIPIYNHARYLRAAVESALRSRLVKEVLLVDDGSSDESLALGDHLALVDPIRVKNLSENPPVNKGAHVRLNELCRAASQPWIAVLNSDDIFAPHRFETAELLIKSTGCEFLSGSIRIIDEVDKPIGVKRGILDPEYPCSQFKHLTGSLGTDELRLVLCNQNILATTSNMLFSRKLFDRIGGFADLRYSHDWDFALRATMHGKCLWTPNQLTLYRIHSTNTIKEDSPHKDGENVRFFYRFLSEFPHLESNPDLVSALQANRYLAPFVGIPQSVNCDRECTASGLALLQQSIRRRLINCALGFALFDYETLLVANTLDVNAVGTQVRKVPRSFFHNVYAGASVESCVSSRSGGRACLLRLPGNSIDAMADYFETICAKDLENRNLMEPDQIMALKTPDLKALSVFNTLLKPRSAKKRCLVLPVFLAVGGVERNTVEVMRELMNEYDFIVVTTERLQLGQGSLHHQVDELGIASIDIAELAPSLHHLSILAQIQRVFLPNVVWVCNGSPWLVANSLSIRRLFAKAAIIDQQVYDTELGWIEHYPIKGIQSFDRFIAINQKIQKKFISAIGIPKHRVDLIYPTINEARIVSALQSCTSVSAGRLGLGLPSGGRLFVFVGRLAPQKRPLLFLEFVGKAMGAHPTDYFLMLGDGPLASECDAYINKHGLKNVRRIAHHQNPAEVFSVSDGLIICSEYEGLPIAMLEALACGLPVLATDVGDIRILIEQYNAGLVVGRNIESGELVERFKEWKCCIDEFRINAMSSRAVVASRFSSREVSNKYKVSFVGAV